jgi:hypothetical protein
MVTFPAVLGGIFVNAAELDPALITVNLQGKISIFFSSFTLFNAAQCC